MKNLAYKSSQRGFTLIEISVALVLLSMTLLLLFSSLYTANKYWKIGENKIEKNNEIRLVTQFIRKQLSQIKPVLWVDDDQRKLLFRGERNELFFTSPLPSHRGGGGIHSQTLKLVHVDNHKQLGLSYSLLTPDSIPFEQPQTEFVGIVGNVDSIALSYFGIERINETPRWRDTWENDHFLPQFVRIKINTYDNTDWPPIIIPVKAAYLQNRPEFMMLAAPS